MQRHQDFFLGLEVEVDRTLGQSGGFGDLGDGGKIVGIPGAQGFRGVEDGRAAGIQPGRRDAGRSCGLGYLGRRLGGASFSFMRQRTGGTNHRAVPPPTSNSTAYSNGTAANWLTSTGDTTPAWLPQLLRT